MSSEESSEYIDENRSPIYAVQRSYYSVTANRIYQRFCEEPGYEISEVFYNCGHAENVAILLQNDRPLEFLQIEFAKTPEDLEGCITTRIVENKLSIFNIRPKTAPIKRRSPEEVIQRLYGISERGFHSAVEACETPEDALDLEGYLEDLEFACTSVDRFVIINW